MNPLSEQVLGILESTPLEKNSKFLLETQSRRAGILLETMSPSELPSLAEHLQSSLTLLLGEETAKDIANRIRTIAGEVEARKKEVDISWVKPSEAYLITDAEEAYPYLVLASVSKKQNVMLIARKMPDKIVSNYGLKCREAYWLSRTDSKESISPLDLDNLARKMQDFFGRYKNGGVAFLDGLEYLLTYHDFRAIMRTLGEVSDHAAMTGSVLLVSVNPLAISQENLALLKSEMTPISRDTMEGVLEEVFLIYRDGRLIAHATRRIRPEMDDEILSSMLVAIQNFVQDSFRDDTGGLLRSLEFGDSRFLIERGQHVYVAAMYGGRIPEEASLTLRRAIQKIETEYLKVLDAWDGNMRSFKGVDGYLQEVIKR
jgi:hypothetical protein